MGSALLWGGSDFLGGMAAKRAGAMHVVMISQVSGLLVVAVVAALTRAYDADPGYLAWGLFAGVAGPVGLVSFYAALARGRMGVVAPIAAMGVLVPVVIGLVAGERPAPVKVVGIAIAVVGIMLASGPELSGHTGRGPVLLAAVAAVAFGLALFGLDGGSTYSPVMTAFVMRTVSSVGFTVVVAVQGLSRLPRGRGLLLAVSAGVGEVIANLLFGLASTMGMLSLLSVLASLYPIATILLARVVLHEKLGRIEYAGVVAALVGVVLIAG
jgi:drug/metabolite transporter (DMT)-like permease